MEDEFEQEFLDQVYVEMTDWTGLETNFLNDVLYLAEKNDEMYELVVEWFRSENYYKRKHYESLMFEVLERQPYES